MAGSVKDKYDKLIIEADELRDETARLRKLLVTVAPELVDSGRPPPVTEYSKNVIERILVYADEGMTEEEWIAELGLSQREWDLWKDNQPELELAIETAWSRAVGWWHQQSRLAIKHNNNRFAQLPYKMFMEQLEKRRAKMNRVDGVDDATELVKVVIGRSGTIGEPCVDDEGDDGEQ